MTYLFFVQGEGRGHLTQALSLKAELEGRGHEILAVMVGPEPSFQLPAFFEKSFQDKLTRIHSPKFVVDKKGAGINMPASLWQALRKLRRYLKSIKEIKKIISQTNPDIIINLYEPLAGLYSRIYQDRRPFFCIAHQYFVEHSAFEFPDSYYSDRLSIRFYNWLTCPGHSRKIALSFTEEADIPQKRLLVCPPLIRQDIKNQVPTDQGHILTYLLNTGYSQEIINWSLQNPDVQIESFWRNPENETTIISSRLTFHNLHGQKFIDYLASSSAYASTAGFESISEAAYLQKNILMIPTKRHFEQKCNAADAKRAGIASIASNFDLSLLINKKTGTNQALPVFKEWVDKYSNKIIQILENK